MDITTADGGACVIECSYIDAACADFGSGFQTIPSIMVGRREAENYRGSPCAWCFGRRDRATPWRECQLGFQLAPDCPDGMLRRR
jgi:hypothetical protein